MERSKAIVKLGILSLHAKIGWSWTEAAISAWPKFFCLPGTHLTHPHSEPLWLCANENRILINNAGAKNVLITGINKWWCTYSLTVPKNGESLNRSNLYSIFLVTYFLINGNSSFKSSMNPWIVFKYQLVKKNRMVSHEN